MHLQGQRHVCRRLFPCASQPAVVKPGSPKASFPLKVHHCVHAWTALCGSYWKPVFIMGVCVREQEVTICLIRCVSNISRTCLIPLKSTIFLQMAKSLYCEIVKIGFGSGFRLKQTFVLSWFLCTYVRTSCHIGIGEGENLADTVVKGMLSNFRSCC